MKKYLLLLFIPFIFAASIQDMHRMVIAKKTTVSVFTDDFTDDNETDLSSHTPSGGTAWTKVVDGASTADIYDNGVDPDTGGGGSGFTVYTSDELGCANHYVQARIKNLASNPGTMFAARLVDEDNFIGFHLSGTGSSGCRLFKYVGGVLTDSIVAFQGVDEQIVRVEITGTTAKIYINSVQQGGDQTIGDAVFTSETSQGIVIDDAQADAAWWDDYEAGCL